MKDSWILHFVCTQEGFIQRKARRLSEYLGIYICLYTQYMQFSYLHVFIYVMQIFTHIKFTFFSVNI